ncbi:hypothetical protein LCGC14_1695990 [marine sediment metagenome]|uniref:Uncharacterized protein n=1 Tax=marine sediment metagenome TaxID=412755 RepID=A0A0F9KJE5_9ZZZZ
MSKIQKSFISAREYLSTALISAQDAHTEIAKWRHPSEGEFSGLVYNIQNKIVRLDDLIKFEEKISGEKEGD